MPHERWNKSHNNKQSKPKTAITLNEESLYIEVTVSSEQSFHQLLLEAIDEAFSSLGEEAKDKIYFYLKGTFGIRRSHIPFRVDDFSDALERIFGVGTRHLELLVIKNLHEKIKIKYKGNVSRWVVPDITFQEYIRFAKMAYENSNERSNELGIEYARS